jgi:hypothetical protein
MIIQIDSREHRSELNRIKKQFDDLGVQYFISKLYVGDYVNLNNPKIAVDRKQNLLEVCSNVTQDHERFRNEMVRAQQNGIKIIFLVEHGDGIESLEDVIFWENPRRHKRKKENGKWVDYETKATTGEILFNILKTMERKYGVSWEFCTKEETGKRIMELLGGDTE